MKATEPRSKAAAARRKRRAPQGHCGARTRGRRSERTWPGGGSARRAGGEGIWGPGPGVGFEGGGGGDDRRARAAASLAPRRSGVDSGGVSEQNGERARGLRAAVYRRDVVAVMAVLEAGVPGEAWQAAGEAVLLALRGSAAGSSRLAAEVSV